MRHTGPQQETSHYQCGRMLWCFGAGTRHFVLKNIKMSWFQSSFLTLETAVHQTNVKTWAFEHLHVHDNCANSIGWSNRLFVVQVYKAWPSCISFQEGATNVNFVLKHYLYAPGVDNFTFLKQVETVFQIWFQSVHYSHWCLTTQQMLTWTVQRSATIRRRG